ncbi:PASTA domain-containing protein [Streptomyces sp. NPDC058683]|uniref:PASTA domain-containing protein n=1 Tax=Streptomyces sp. NPDC058683 TaxID=3346597 RepID=UPI00365A290F
MRKGPVLLALVVVLGLLALSQHARQQTAELPDLRGLTLRQAQLAARDAGFRQLAGTDAFGRHRVPVLGSNWRVCSQQPPPARHSLTTPVTVRVVKTGEACPRRP